MRRLADGFFPLGVMAMWGLAASYTLALTLQALASSTETTVGAEAKVRRMLIGAAEYFSGN